MPPARGAATQGTSRRSVESVAREFHQLSQELRLKQSLAGLSLTPHVDEQQGYSSGQYPHVYVEPFPDPLQSVVPWQQRQLQQQDYEHVRHDQALPSFQPQQKEQHQQIQPYPSLVQQHAIPQDQNTFFEQRREVKRHYAPTPWRSQSINQPMDAMAETRLPTGIGVRKIEPITMSTHKERRGLRHQFSRSLSDRSGSFGRASLQEFSPSHDSTAPVRLSGVTADDDDLEMLQRASLGPGTFGSTESDEVLQSRIPREQIQSSIHMPLASQTAVPVFPEAREGLKRLRADIEDLSDSSDSSPEAVSGHLEMMRLSLSEEECSDHTANNVHEETDAGSGRPDDLRPDTEETASPPGSTFPNKRSQLDDTNEDRALAEVRTSRKRTRLSNLRFFCCFRDGPGRKCSGTDDTISEALKKLSEQHDTHVCDRCWVLKVNDDSSGRFVHPNGDQTCLDHCLSPQCHGSTPTIGHRHLFNQSTCGTKTSRVRPGDSEAVYRFIFRLVHPDLDCPASIFTAEHSLHLDAVPRQSRRKLNREELTARANDLEKRLEAGEQQNAVNATRILQLEKELADAHRATARAEERNAALEKQSRRIVAMLSDALRTGVFMHTLDHQSLLRRVEEDAPGALIHQTQSLLTPSASDRSRNSSATPARVDMAGQDWFLQPTAYNDLNTVAPLGTALGTPKIDQYMSDLRTDQFTIHGESLGEVDVFAEPGESDVTTSQI